MIRNKSAKRLNKKHCPSDKIQVSNDKINKSFNRAYIINNSFYHIRGLDNNIIKVLPENTEQLCCVLTKWFIFNQFRPKGTVLKRLQFWIVILFLDSINMQHVTWQDLVLNMRSMHGFLITCIKIEIVTFIHFYVSG